MMAVRKAMMTMKKFLYLFLGVDDSGLSPEELQQRIQRRIAWMQELGRGGHFHSNERLERGATTISGKAKNVTDGPFAEAKDVVGGFLIVTAKDLDQAVELAKGCPIFEAGGRVEVRAVVEPHA
jgi:hypothetical protein